MTKFLMWLALAALVIFAIRSKIRQAQKRYQDQFRQQQQAAAQPQPQPQPQPGYKARAAAQAANDAEVMLQCAHCGVFYPASETVQTNGRDYCSAAHAALPSA
ncbi:hypothetical protein GTP38_24840 [Duganella sp. FT94W]|uniref:Preprotein translocase subunit YajC n=1 Tax=Duganella lactea TaxID=2692173 RepID=A0ABW9VD48_9BURK|nr:PP0621 family protein [Duganella lactea]MYM37558.1 hypothetical protein [Duganella lactea]